MPKHAKQDRKRIPIDIPIVSESSLAGAGAARLDRSSYGERVDERNRYVDARYRAQQRAGYVVAGSAAGALALSLAFMRGIAPSPVAAGLLLAGWAALMVALGASLAHHHLAQRAFDAYVRDLDRVFGMRAFPDPRGMARRLPLAASLALLAGFLCLAAVAFLNVAAS